MLSNNTITYYHKSLNEQTRLEEWTRYLYDEIWEFGRINGVTDKGYENSNSVEIRIPIEKVEDTSIFQLGDMVCIGNHGEIQTREDLEGLEYYNITSIKINNFGSVPHIHLGGR